MDNKKGFSTMMIVLFAVVLVLVVGGIGYFLGRWGASGQTTGQGSGAQAGGPSPSSIDTLFQPTITSIAPASITLGPSTATQAITVAGANFSAENNRLIFINTAGGSVSIPTSTLGNEPASSADAAFYKWSMFTYGTSSANGTSFTYINNDISSPSNRLFSCAYGTGTGTAWVCGSAPLAKGTYKVYVENGANETSNGVDFTVQ